MLFASFYSFLNIEFNIKKCAFIEIKLKSIKIRTNTKATRLNLAFLFYSKNSYVMSDVLKLNSYYKWTLKILKTHITVQSLGLIVC